MAARRWVALTGAAALLLTACTGSSNDGNTKGGTLSVALDGDPGALNPAFTTSDVTHAASELVFNGLVRLTPQLEPVPELAKSWEVLENGALYRFNLRNDVTWHDGKPFTSADVKYTFDIPLVLSRFNRGTNVLTDPDVLSSITTPDPDTVEFRFTQPYAPLLQQLDVSEAPILPKHLAKGMGVFGEPANNKPVGTGPFKLVSYTPGSELKFTANREYFKKDLPYLDEVVMRVIPDKGKQVAALEAGQADWLFGVPGPDLPRLRSSGKFDFITTPLSPRTAHDVDVNKLYPFYQEPRSGGSNCIMTVSFNLNRPLFQDVRLRRALYTALDREEFVDRVLFGQGKVAEAPISSGIPFAHASGLKGMPRFDRAEAERLLDEAGWKRPGSGTRSSSGVAGVPDGTPLAFGFVYFPPYSAYAQLLRAQLAAVGAEVMLKPLEPLAFVDTVFRDVPGSPRRSGTASPRDFDTNIINYCNENDPEIGVRRMYVSSHIGATPLSNSSVYRNPEVDKLFDDARTTVDPKARTQIFRTLQEQLVQDLPYLWLVETQATRVFANRCKGFTPSGHFAEAASCTR